MADLPEISVLEVAEHNNEQSTWIILNDKVYDVTKFLMEHPGGEKVILQQAGQNATDSFNDVGHSSDAKAMAEEYVIGRLGGFVQSGTPSETVKRVDARKDSWSDIILSPTWTNFLIPVGISVAVFISYRAVNYTIHRIRF